MTFANLYLVFSCRHGLPGTGEMTVTTIEARTPATIGTCIMAAQGVTTVGCF